MKSDFLLAITQLSAEKNLPKEVVLAAVEAALSSAYRKHTSFAPNQNVVVKINPSSGKVQVWAEKTVVETPSDPRHELSLAEARQLRSDAAVGEAIMVEATPADAGRIAAQTAKQVILQRLHEAEHSAIFEEYTGREGDIVAGVIQRMEPKQAVVDLGRTEAVLPSSEQVPSERYRPGQRLRFYLLEVARTARGPRVILSRSHPNLVRRLFELEVPEVYGGVVEVKAVAREAGSRSKVAVAARQTGVDPVGCCVGLRGIRIQNIVHELNGEKIDVVAWNPDIALFIASALSPAQVLKVRLEGDSATVVVPDKQLSLAIGKEGQNARLAAKLTGQHIDIKSASQAEAEALLKPEAEMREVVPAGVLAEAVPEPVLAVVEEAEAEKPAAAPVEEVPAVAFVPPVEIPAAKELRFAEDIFTQPVTPGAKAKKAAKKKGAPAREKKEEGVKVKKARGVERGVLEDYLKEGEEPE